MNTHITPPPPAPPIPINAYQINLDGTVEFVNKGETMGKAYTDTNDNPNNIVHIS